ncbi:hypothetical protein GCM10023189_44770 [Nibrella saemangeumensis]|uniref:DUF4397 domain-containing protein n=1 Tax=Nibrella saemangeumensis TaxID=1084526 RepID=A0ABP8NGE7_9BACT
MKSFRQQFVLIGLLVGLWACNKEKDPSPALPSYLRVPTTLSGYKGSGKLTISGKSVNLAAEGPEQQQANSRYSGVVAEAIGIDLIRIRSTFNQPLDFANTSTVPAEHRSNATLRIMNITKTGSYPMGLMSPTPRGEIADLEINQPGPALYITSAGSLTINEITTVKQEGSLVLRRLKGTFDATLFGTGTNIPDKEPHVAGTVDVLLLFNI